MELKKNRIAMVSPSQNAYSETFIQAQKKGLKSQIFYYYGGYLPTCLEDVGMLNNDVNKIITKLKRKFRLSKFTSIELSFIKSLKKNRIQLIFAQYGNTAHRILEICKYLNLPLITHFHGYDASIYSVIESCNKYRDVFEYSTYVIAVSHSMQKRLIELGCSKEKVIYNPCGPDNSFLEIKPQFSEPLFIGLGRFVDKKAPYYTILAFKKVQEKFPNAQLIIGGHGELQEVCENLIRFYELEKNVLLPGILSREELAAYLSKGFAFVQHSITAINGDQEGTPVAILEASAAGLPVIATFHAGIPDVIIDRETGFLVAEHDVDGMAGKMIQILEDKTLAQQMGIKGKERVKGYFTLKKQLETLDELIDKAIHKK